MKRFKWNVKELRQAAGLERMDIVRRANISYPTVLSMETKTTARLDAAVLSELMRLFNCGMSDLVQIIDVDDDDSKSD